MILPLKVHKLLNMIIKPKGDKPYFKVPHSAKINPFTNSKWVLCLNQCHKAFTIIELVVVILIISLVSTLILRPNFTSFTYWEQEGAIRKLSEHVTFLFNQAITDGRNYRIEYHFGTGNDFYQIGQVSGFFGESGLFGLNAESSSPQRSISAEIDRFLNPIPSDIGETQAPESIPSMAKPFYLPEGLKIKQVKTLRGEFSESNPDFPVFTGFSSRGFADFTVIHLTLERQEESYVTLLINPFTGIVDIYREYREFNWNYNNAT